MKSYVERSIETIEQLRTYDIGLYPLGKEVDHGSNFSMHAFSRFSVNNNYLDVGRTSIINRRNPYLSDRKPAR